MKQMVLVGLRGAGKTSAGRLAAVRLGAAFHDVDEEIALRAGRSVAQIFALDGEPAFRSLECQVTQELLGGPGVLATGGGVVLDRGLREVLRRGQRTLWLVAPPDTLAARIRGSDRPSLTGAPPEEELAALLGAREPLYRECARWVLDTADLSLEDVADAIQHLWATLPGDHIW